MKMHDLFYICDEVDRSTWFDKENTTNLLGDACCCCPTSGLMNPVVPLVVFIDGGSSTTSVKHALLNNTEAAHLVSYSIYPSHLCYTYIHCISIIQCQEDTRCLLQSVDIIHMNIQSHVKKNVKPAASRTEIHEIALQSLIPE